jgi:hypothetical protein
MYRSIILSLFLLICSGCATNDLSQWDVKKDEWTGPMRGSSSRLIRHDESTQQVRKKRESTNDNSKTSSAEMEVIETTSDW